MLHVQINRVAFSGAGVESDYRYYQRRAAAEWSAAQRAVTPQARDRRVTLARKYDMMASSCMEVQPLPLLA